MLIEAFGVVAVPRTVDETSSDVAHELGVL